MHEVSTGWVNRSLSPRPGISEIKPGLGGPVGLRDKFHGLSPGFVVTD